MTRRLILMVLATCLLVPRHLPAADAGETTDTRPSVEASRPASGMRRIAVLPVAISPSIELPAAERDVLSRRLEAAAAALLVAAGIEPVGTEAMRSIQTQARQSLGSLYDPVTGQADDAKLKAFREFTENEFDATNQVDGYLRLTLFRQVAYVTGAWAEWSGSKQFAYGAENAPLGVSLERVPVPLGALTLGAILEDSSHRSLRARQRGLQLTDLLRHTRGVGFGAIPLGTAHWFSVPDREALVVRTLLASLLEEPAPGAVALIELPREAPLPPLESPEYASAEVLLRRHPRIGLAPVDFWIGDNARQPRYRALITERLQKFGFEAIPADELVAAFDAETRSSGGFHDPFTGVLDSQRRDAAVKRVIAAFRTQAGLSAVLVPSFVQTYAPVAQGNAQWDGVGQLALVMGKGLGRIFNLDTILAGSLPARSLVLTLSDSEDRVIFQDRGGVQLLSLIEKGSIVPVPESEWFADPERDEKAVNAATSGLRPKPKQTVPR